jgi:hypothetical protein
MRTLVKVMLLVLCVALALPMLAQNQYIYVYETSTNLITRYQENKTTGALTKLGTTSTHINYNVNSGTEGIHYPLLATATIFGAPLTQCLFVGGNNTSTGGSAIAEFTVDIMSGSLTYVGQADHDQPNAMNMPIGVVTTPSGNLLAIAENGVSNGQTSIYSLGIGTGCQLGAAAHWNNTNDTGLDSIGGASVMTVSSHDYLALGDYNNDVVNAFDVTNGAVSFLNALSVPKPPLAIDNFGPDTCSRGGFFYMMDQSGSKNLDFRVLGIQFGNLIIEGSDTIVEPDYYTAGATMVADKNRSYIYVEAQGDSSQKTFLFELQLVSGNLVEDASVQPRSSLNFWPQYQFTEDNAGAFLIAPQAPLFPSSTMKETVIKYQSFSEITPSPYSGPTSPPLYVEAAIAIPAPYCQ